MLCYINYSKKKICCKINRYLLYFNIQIYQKIAKNYLKMKKKLEINIENEVIREPADFVSIQKDLIKKSAEKSEYKI